ncbi:collagen alpha-1(I) chain-like [Onychostruthus taczanowskii]|uniref:collagen alpha-1(I) chain-like n=1 Tax=Onychostruthus taczanowskii TaxID=356909 RepID=UPI001B8037FE|nr:collagen alpha-1(I) chain-like [Onychostruthus taczanowskii]
MITNYTTFYEPLSEEEETSESSMNRNKSHANRHESYQTYSSGFLPEQNFGGHSILSYDKGKFFLFHHPFPRLCERKLSGKARTAFPSRCSLVTLSTAWGMRGTTGRGARGSQPGLRSNSANKKPRGSLVGRSKTLTRLGVGRWGVRLGGFQTLARQHRRTHPPRLLGPQPGEATEPHRLPPIPHRERALRAILPPGAVARTPAPIPIPAGTAGRGGFPNTYPVCRGWLEDAGFCASDRLLLRELSLPSPPPPLPRHPHLLWGARNPPLSALPPPRPAGALMRRGRGAAWPRCSVPTARLRCDGARAVPSRRGRGSAGAARGRLRREGRLRAPAPPRGCAARGTASLGSVFVRSGGTNSVPAFRRVGGAGGPPPSRSGQREVWRRECREGSPGSAPAPREPLPVSSAAQVVVGEKGARGTPEVRSWRDAGGHGGGRGKVPSLTAPGLRGTEHAQLPSASKSGHRRIINI